MKCMGIYRVLLVSNRDFSDSGLTGIVLGVSRGFKGGMGE